MPIKVRASPAFSDEHILIVEKRTAGGKVDRFEFDFATAPDGKLKFELHLGEKLIFEKSEFAEAAAFASKFAEDSTIMVASFWQNLRNSAAQCSRQGYYMARAVNRRSGFRRAQWKFQALTRCIGKCGVDGHECRSRSSDGACRCQPQVAGLL
jgi:hypothetical protein